MHSTARQSFLFALVAVSSAAWAGRIPLDLSTASVQSAGSAQLDLPGAGAASPAQRGVRRLEREEKFRDVLRSLTVRTMGRSAAAAAAAAGPSGLPHPRVLKIDRDGDDRSGFAGLNAVDSE